MALPQLIPSHSSSSSLTHQPSINPNAVSPYLLNPNFKPFSNSSSLFQSRRFHRLSSLRCFASSFPEKRHLYPPQSDESVQLPLFPLPLVLFSGAVLPLQIFEFHYRIMMHTLLHTDLHFGVIYSDTVGGTSDVGCVGEIFKHERLVDDRFFLICKGQERFRVTNIVRSTFEGAPKEQQAWLELEDTAARLRREKGTLRNTLNYLSAASAVKDVFPSS
ncbi:hypothetical protein J1N35_004749 [Gossypium stocksii]|uniref:Lon N-terminal domain-containing protein n=1 Tax=Gossypium stocksii TaxID=47602 RepID=A0A9D3WBK9_9ROSI|nr:hypothetical protein J1N35_004749 [Gossypium stocksii]